MAITGRFKHFLFCIISILFGNMLLAQADQCPANIDFEFGDFTNWTCYTGSVTQQNGVNIVLVTPSGPVSGRHTLIDNSSAGLVDPYGGFPVLCPNGSGYSIKLGNNQTSRQAERVSYSFTIPAGQTEYSLVYQYAVVFQDPNHQPQEQPRFTAKVYDVSTNDYVSCATFDFVATSNLPGFVHAPGATNVWYKPWTSVTLNLSGFAGKTVIVEFTTADCTQGAHFGYAYVDVNIGCTSPVRGGNFCPGTTSLTLNAPFGYQHYYWYTSDMSQLLGTDSSLTITPPPAVNTVYALDIVPYPGFGCRDTVYATVKPAQAPVADAGADQSICYGKEVTLGAAAMPGNSYSWFPSAGLNDPAAATPSASPTNDTKYVLTATNINSGCARQDSVVVKVGPQLFTEFSVNAPDQCINNNNFQFTNPNPPELLYQWKFGDGSTSTQLNPIHRYDKPGAFSVQLITSSMEGCADSSSQDVNVFDLPKGSITSPSTNICEGIPFILTSSGGVNYNWYRDGQLAGTSGISGFNATQPGKYTVIVIDEHGCQQTGDNSVALTITKKPVADFSFDKYCVELPTTFTNKSIVNNSLPVQYVWDFGNNTSSDQHDAVVHFGNAGAFNVKLSVTPVACPQLTSTIEKTVTIQKPVPGNNYAPKNAIENRPLQLKARDIGTSYEWMPATWLGSIFSSQTAYTGNKEQQYRIKIINPSGCTTVDTQLVKIFKEIEVYVPKAFTPNNDGQNDRMYPFLVGIKELKSFRIINRWGAVVYESKTDLPGWDGMYKGKPQPMDGYVWEAQANDLDGKTVIRKGSFTLIR
jgi:gliding motility-associated-like protein